MNFFVPLFSPLNFSLPLLSPLFLLLPLISLLHIFLSPFPRYLFIARRFFLHRLLLCISLFQLFSTLPLLPLFYFCFRCFLFVLLSPSHETPSSKLSIPPEFSLSSLTLSRDEFQGKGRGKEGEQAKGRRRGQRGSKAEDKNAQMNREREGKC